MQTISERKRIGLASIPVVQQAPVKFFRPCLKKPFELPDMEGGVPIIPVSGGADSSYLAILLHALFPEVPWRLVFTDTGTAENPVEEPEVYTALDRLEVYLGKKIERLMPEKGLFEIIEQYGGFLPGHQSRYCTRMLKKVPFERWLKQFAGVDKFVFVGIRADEAGRVAFDLAETETIMPFVQMGLTREDIFRGLEATVGIPAMYRRRTRSGCFMCPFQRRSELVGLLQEKPTEFLKAEGCEHVAVSDLARWSDGIPLWKDSGIAANWLTLPKPDEGEIAGKKALMAPDLFGARIYVGGEFFTDGWPGCAEFVWHQRVVSVAPTLHHIKGQLADRYHHLLATAEVYGMTPEQVRRQIKFGIWVVELPSSVFDPQGPREKGYTWQSGWAYKQLRHIVSWTTRALHAEGMRQIAASSVSSELSVQAEWRDSAKAGLQEATFELGCIVASQWFKPAEEKREETEEERLTFLPCPMCSL